jgi:hypothetical protein
MRISKQAVLAAPGIVLSALPIGACPACWPVYASILSALGASFLLSSAYLLPPGRGVSRLPTVRSALLRKVS